MITGASLIGSSERDSAATFSAINPATGETLQPSFSSAGPDEVAAACALAEAAYPSFSELALEDRAAFLEAVADAIVAIGDELIDRAVAESGLPRGRIEGERGRTVGQLRLFASVVREGAWVQATVDPALPDRAPLPRPDLRRRHVSVGPVAVFGASNFPLAFSVAGGDTASALAAGSPVVVKGHPAHPGTGEFVARAIQSAVKACGLHEGVFSFLPGDTNELGGALVADPRIKAVGFTGSRGGGLALVRIAAGRDEPIPVYAEMSSINPVLLFPAALKARGAALAPAYVQSLTMGAGQFCTNPGVLIAPKGPELDAFVAAAAAAMTDSQPQAMLSPGIHASFEQGVDALSSHSAVTSVARGCVGEGVNQARGALFRTDAKSFLADPALAHEVFGSSSIVIEVDDMSEAAELIGALEGQLTATLLIDAEDEPAAAALVPLLARKVGRILANGWPTGVEVSHAMVHGGPYPATSDGRTTSVGTLAIDRFLRPVCYQNLPDALLPAPLRSDNPWQLVRRVDGKIEQA
ncbi:MULTISPECIES: aldehyde dehydrogenase (NADP(+)) [unclassified Sphingomonas]|uniref:aldehyde dehydrogenase (NADP(+)) n=1 Tax=unclassified Sphingomonas TaxID=196159 RepID=UPI00226A3E04|nr:MULTISPECIES: aldehyde dehydrogenase (NADP(+)) [unclassified Sphingomonas]